MRTTVSISDEVLTAAKRRARELGQTLGEFVDAALQRELSEPPGTPAPAVPVFRGGDGPRPGLDLRSNRALTEVLDEGRTLTELR